MPSPPESTTDPIEYLPDCAEVQLDDVLSLLDRWSQRTEDHVTALRKHARRGFRTSVCFEVVGKNLECFAAFGQKQPIVFHIPVRNLSQTGVGLLAPPEFSPRSLSDMTPILRSETVLAVGTQAKISIPSSIGPGLLMMGTVVRLRPTHHGFLEAGVKFTGRA